MAKCRYNLNLHLIPFCTYYGYLLVFALYSKFVPDYGKQKNKQGTGLNSFSQKTSKYYNEIKELHPGFHIQTPNKARAVRQWENSSWRYNLKITQQLDSYLVTSNWIFFKKDTHYIHDIMDMWRIQTFWGCFSFSVQNSHHNCTETPVTFY